jgi:lysophospholipase L1-like esterase
MYGDSITAQSLYTNFTEAFVLTRFPTVKIDWWNAGWGGDRVTGGGGGSIDVRLQRDLLAYKPTYVTIMLGMNDASYRPFDQGIFDTYQKGYQHIVDVIKKADPATRFTLILPSPFDDVTRASSGYNAVLIKYGDYVKTLAQTNGFGVADFNTPVNAMLAKANEIDPNLATQILPDRVHPSPGGHIVMAEALLQSWNFPSVVSDVKIESGSGKVKRSRGAKVTNVKKGASVAWDELDQALPLPINVNDPVIALVLKSSDVVTALDQETLQVTGLKAPKYTLSIDGKPVGDFAQEDLAGGINLATLPTPMYAQAEQVLTLTNQHDSTHEDRFHAFLPPLEDQEQSIVAQQRAAAQPVVHHFELAPVQ